MSNKDSLNSKCSKIAWIERFTNVGPNYAISIDATNDISYFLGLFNGRSVVGKNIFDDPAQIILVKLAPNGIPINSWSLIQFSATRDEVIAGDLKVKNDRFYTIISFSGDLVILNNQQVDSVGMGNELMLVTDDNGNLIFYHLLSNVSSSSQIAVDSKGNSYVIGSFTSELLIDGKTVFKDTSGNNSRTNSITTNDINSNFFVLKFDSTGLLKWFINGSGEGNFTGQDITILPSGNLVATGTFSTKIILGNRTLINNNTQFTSWIGILTSNGNWIASSSIRADTSQVLNSKSSEFLIINSLGTDKDGNIYAVGQASGTFIFGSIALKLFPIGIFVTKWNFCTVKRGGVVVPLLLEGNKFPVKTKRPFKLEWLRNIVVRIPPENGINPHIVVDASGNSFVSGYSLNGVEFQSPDDKIKREGSGSLDFFLGGLSPNGTWVSNFSFPGVIDIDSNLIATDCNKKGISLFAAGTNLVNVDRRNSFISRIIFHLK